MRRVAVSKEWAIEHFGVGNRPWPELNSALMRIHSTLLPLNNYDFSQDNETRYEELLHELSHHFTLNPASWSTPRDTSVGQVLRELGPATQEGNECDALALSILVSEMINQPITIAYVDLAVRQSNLKFMSVRQARAVVRSAIQAPHFWEIGKAFAEEICFTLYEQDKLRASE